MRFGAETTIAARGRRATTARRFIKPRPGVPYVFVPDDVAT